MQHQATSSGLHSELQRLLSQGPEDLLLFAFEKVLLTGITARPIPQRIAGGFVFQPQSVQVVREGNDRLVHGKRKKMEKLLQNFLLS
tara:strand:+ start:439 stop:699 length:261 start_codon:yes stop_codon:yes gene_type:complete